MAQLDNNGRAHMHHTTDEIRSFNDCFRRSLIFGGQTVAGVSALDTDAKTTLLRLD
jgi:hypothetical protein